MGEAFENKSETVARQSRGIEASSALFEEIPALAQDASITTQSNEQEWPREIMKRPQNAPTDVRQAFKRQYSFPSEDLEFPFRQGEKQGSM